jgi:predicted membrane channel-forming protein YqfA (hemolysin III family)
MKFGYFKYEDILVSDNDTSQIRTHGVSELIILILNIYFIEYLYDTQQIHADTYKIFHIYVSSKKMNGKKVRLYYENPMGCIRFNLRYESI